MIYIPPANAAAILSGLSLMLKKTPANLSNQKITLSTAAHRQKTNLPEPMNSLAHERIN